MKITIDTEKQTLFVDEENNQRQLDLYSKESFEILSYQWKKIGWNQKHTYTFSWMGRPVIQLPEDMIRMQEVIYSIKPDVIIETGVAHGGSLIYYASICKAMEKGRIIGVDIEIRPHNRTAIENHELYPSITLIEGSSTDINTFKEVRSNLNDGDTVLVILDSCHTKEHVYNELELYSQLVTVGSYIVVEDGIMEDLFDVPRGNKSWKEDNPVIAVQEFLQKNEDFILETPKWVFNESELDQNITHWNSAWLKRIK